ncbi:BlaI/MecI/CopY family transcriptional regulator [Verrucomicrobiota bacterium]
MKKRVPGISPAEWEVMRVVWAKAPITANEVVDELSGSTDWNDRTIRTMLGRLVTKGALTYRSKKNTYLYRPRVEPEECRKAESRSFLDRVFAGEAGPALIHFAKHADLSRTDVRELRRILSKKEKKS